MYYKCIYTYVEEEKQFNILFTIRLVLPVYCSVWIYSYKHQLAVSLSSKMLSTCKAKEQQINNKISIW